VISRDGDTVTVRATRIATAARRGVYAQVPAITDYIQQDPSEGAPISERTESWGLFDDTNLYFTCRCWDQRPERIVANDMRRDSSNLRQNDNVAVELDTFHDKRNGFLFYVTPVGGMFDAATSDERINNSDWNTVWQAKVGRFEGGWTAEIAIPFKSLPRMFVAALVQYASATSSLSTNLRFRWEYQPGSELFVVYTEGRDTLPPTGAPRSRRAASSSRSTGC
jgi:hypothetical protein